jgi:hypothetical protein
MKSIALGIFRKRIVISNLSTFGGHKPEHFFEINFFKSFNSIRHSYLLLFYGAEKIRPGWLLCEGPVGHASGLFFGVAVLDEGPYNVLEGVAGIVAVLMDELRRVEAFVGKVSTPEGLLMPHFPVGLPLEKLSLAGLAVAVVSAAFVFKGKLLYTIRHVYPPV